jgi:AraC-like DNA-binding protein
MQKTILSSDELPASLDDQGRFSLWRDLYTACYGSVDLSRPDDRKFLLRAEFARFGAVGVGRFHGTINRAARTVSAIKSDANDDLCLCVNRAHTPVLCTQQGREAVLAPNGAALVSNTEAGEIRGEAENTWCLLVLPRDQLHQRVVEVENLTAVALDPTSPAMQHIGRYLDILLGPDGVADDAALSAHVEATLIDLITLVLAPCREAAAIANARGLRAARLQEILTGIKARFADEAFSSAGLAQSLGLSPRYVSDLLFETGLTFTERVLELRLQKARAMLSDPRLDAVKIGDIAHACGFGDVSYFNRCFRRRFGTAPSDYRGRPRAGDLSG